MKITNKELETEIFKLDVNYPNQIKLVDLFPNALEKGQLNLENIDFTRLGAELNIDFTNCTLRNCYFKSQNLACDFTHANLDASNRFEGCFVDSTCKGLSLQENNVAKKSSVNTLWNTNFKVNAIESDRRKDKRIKEWQKYLIKTYGAELIQYENLKHYSNDQRPLVMLSGKNEWYIYNTPFTDYYFEEGLGWKLHISVADEDIKKAYNLIVSRLLSYGIDFKVFNIEIKINFNEKQIVIYLTKNNNPLIPINEVEKLIKQINEIFTKENIRAGTIPNSDVMINKFVSIRTDRYQLGNFVEYISATAVGTNFNPCNLPNPFQRLLKDNKPFNLMDHFKAFRGTQLKFDIILSYTLESFLREYTFLDLIKITNERQLLYKDILIHYLPSPEDLIRPEKKDSIDQTIILTVVMMISFLHFTQIRYKQGLVSLNFSNWYIKDDNFKKDLHAFEKMFSIISSLLIERMNMINIPMNLITFEQAKKEWMNAISLKKIHPDFYELITAENPSPEKMVLEADKKEIEKPSVFSFAKH